MCLPFPSCPRHARKPAQALFAAMDPSGAPVEAPEPLKACHIAVQFHRHHDRMQMFCIADIDIDQKPEIVRFPVNKM
jgi:hypothetical protein